MSNRITHNDTPRPSASSQNKARAAPCPTPKTSPSRQLSRLASTPAITNSLIFRTTPRRSHPREDSTIIALYGACERAPLPEKPPLPAALSVYICMRLSVYTLLALARVQRPLDALQERRQSERALARRASFFFSLSLALALPSAPPHARASSSAGKSICLTVKTTSGRVGGERASEREKQSTNISPPRRPRRFSTLTRARLSGALSLSLSPRSRCPHPAPAIGAFFVGV